MSNSDQLNCKSDEIPSTEDVIEEVVDSCNNLKLETAKNDSEKENVDEDFIDENYIRDLDNSSSPVTLKERKNFANIKKEEGNSLFKSHDFDSARKKYTEALRTCPLNYSEERAILFANRGAAKMKEGLKKEAIQDCTKAVELNSNYVKAYIRRAKLYEEEEKLEEALEDYKKILTLDEGNSEAKLATMRLPGQIEERNERLKTEMLGSLKELGNMILKPFGLSTDNFQVQQDPNSGGYSINFTQNKK